MSDNEAGKLRRILGTGGCPAAVIAVTGGKGGVGKTAVAANLSVCLGASGKRVVLVDADFSLANLDVVMGINSRYNLSHVISGAKTIDEIMQVGPAGVEVICSASGLEALADMNEFQRQRLVREMEALTERSDVVVVDTAAGIGKSVTSFCLAANHVLVVTTGDPAAMTDAYATIKVLVKRGFSGRVSLVVNMADSLAQGKQVYHQIASVARRFLNTHIYYGSVLLKDERLRASVRRRKPVVLDCPACQISSALGAMAAKLARVAPAEMAGEGFFRKVVNWFF